MQIQLLTLRPFNILCGEEDPCKSLLCMTDAEKQECILPHRHLESCRGFLIFPFFLLVSVCSIPSRLVSSMTSHYLSRKETRPLLTMASVQVLYILASHVACQLPFRPTITAFASSTQEYKNIVSGLRQTRNISCLLKADILFFICGVV